MCECVCVCMRMGVHLVCVPNCALVCMYACTHACTHAVFVCACRLCVCELVCVCVYVSKCACRQVCDLCGVMRPDLSTWLCVPELFISMSVETLSDGSVFLGNSYTSYFSFL